MSVQKNRACWLKTVLAVFCCAALLICAAETVHAVQCEKIEPVYYEEHNMQLDASPVSPLRDEPAYSETILNAGLTLRQQLKERENQAIVYVKLPRNPGNNDEEVLNGVIRDIFHTAIAHTGNSTEGDYIFHQFLKYSAGLGGDMDSQYYYLQVVYNVSYFTTAEQEAQVDLQVETILKQLDLEDATDYQKIKGVYDWLCQNVTYDYENLYDEEYILKHSAYAALINKTAVCQGYATAMYRLLLELGVDVRYVGGWGFDDEGRPGAHGWNIVKLGDVYYNVDATWDATYAQYNYPYQYFLKSDADFENHQRDDEEYDFVNTADYPMTQTSHDGRSYVVTFRDANGAQISSATYYYGDTIVAPTPPAKEADNVYAYNFVGWGADVGYCTGHQTFTAVYEKEYIAYLVEFRYADGTLISSRTYHYGDEVDVPEQVMPPEGQEGVVHNGWDSPITKCYTDKVYVATFVATVTKGDFDGDHRVTSEDVVYLLWHTMFPAGYPIQQNADYTADGIVTNEDVIYLLWHTMFPAGYPLN